MQSITTNNFDRQLVLVTPGSSSLADVEKREALLVSRQAAALEHHHRQIWVKEPHGGVYRKAENHSQSITSTPALGYEVVKRGPTTNIVGNHMTQAAIDLVQAELEYVEEPLLMLGSTIRLSQAVTDKQDASEPRLKACSESETQNQDAEALELLSQQQQPLAGVTGFGAPDMAALRKAARLLRSKLARSM